MATDTEPTTVALVYAPGTEDVYDRCWTWEAGQNYALSGYVVKAVAPDGGFDVEQAQRLYDAERERFMDCFDRTEPFSHA